ncbi:MAG: GntR family transcriptional regulator [Rhizomicrobium sp.]
MEFDRRPAAAGSLEDPARQRAIMKKDATPHLEPLYLRLVQALKQQIESGRVAVGSHLPSEGDLSRQYSVSRHTVRAALRQLQEDGLVAPRKGSGTTVIGLSAAQPYVHEVASIEQLIEYAVGTHYEAGNSKLIRANKVLAKRLDCAVGHKWMRIEALRFAPDQRAPICWMEVYVHADYADVARVIGRQPGPIYAWIEKLHGETITDIEQVLSAREVPAAPAKKLGIKPGEMGIEVRRTYRTKSGKVVEIAFNLHPAERFRHAMTLRRNRAARR